MNFIFDIGNVLVSYEPQQFLEMLFPDKDVSEKILRLIFLGPEWVKMDLGTLTRKEATDVFCAREPGLEPEIRQTMQNLDSIFTPNDDTVELLPIIKNSGHSLYYLSNIHAEVRDYLLREHKYFEMFDGGVCSCDTHTMKPSLEIYRHLLKKYTLDPKDCVFFDDRIENIISAQNEGINGILFTNAESVKQYQS